jgi:hypothetical protein
LKIHYRAGKSPTPIPSLGGGLWRHRPYLAVRLYGPSGSILRDGLLDTGSDDTIFHEDLAALVGIDLATVSPTPILLAGRGVVPCRYVPTTLRITDGVSETYEWSAVVGFVPVRLRHVLLGHAGFLQFFDTEFRGADREVVLTTNHSFPGRRT